MTALSKPRATVAREGLMLSGSLAAAVLAYAGALAVRDAAGNIKPGVTGLGLKGLGRFRDTVDNSSGAAGDLSAGVEIGVFRFDNSASADAIAAADIGKACYIVDDQTVAKTDGAGTRSVAGIVADVDDNGVFVDFRGAADPGKVYLQIDGISTKAADAAVARLVVPVAGKLTAIRSVSNAALATGNATLTAAINGTAVTGGVVTIAQSGSAAGDVDSAAPTAANAVVPGDIITITGGGASTATATANLVIEITR